MRDVRFLITGGTIENLEYADPREAPSLTDSIIPKLLKQYRVTAPTEVEILMFKDSRHVTDEDRYVMSSRCAEISEEGIVITHGTMTMSETAKFIGEKNIPKTIILVGAMVLPNKEGSDAFFNLGYALAAAQHLPHGVYVAMHGTIFNWRDVRKNIEAGMFEGTE